MIRTDKLETMKQITLNMSISHLRGRLKAKTFQLFVFKYNMFEINLFFPLQQNQKNNDPLK